MDMEIPVIAEADVLVVGGGPGGLGASVMAARAGASVILAERCGILGGMASQGEVTPFMANHYTVEKKEGRTTVLELHVAEGDMGKVIGKQGRIAKALRSVVKAAAAKEDKRVVVDIV